MVHRPFVLSKLPHWALHDDLREDLINAIFVQAWKAWPRYRPSKGMMTTWLEEYIRMICDRWIRTAYCHREVFHRELRSLDVGPDDRDTWDNDHEVLADPHSIDPLQPLLEEQDDIDTARLRAKLLEAARRMPPGQARAWKKRLQGQTLEEIASSEGVSRQAIQQRLDKRRHNLQDIATRHFAACG